MQVSGAKRRQPRTTRVDERVGGNAESSDVGFFELGVIDEQDDRVRVCHRLGKIRQRDVLEADQSVWQAGDVGFDGC
jgi:hypothetical protein